MIDKNDNLTNQLFTGETNWFHMMKNMIDNGDAAKMGGGCFLVYVVIKSHINFHDGDSFPRVETIGEKAGMKRQQVMRHLKTLEDMGYLAIRKEGRNNHYQLREKVEIYQGGQQTHVATWDYVPSLMKQAHGELKNFLMTGKHDGSIIIINQLNLNVQANSGGENTQLNVSEAIKDPEVRAAAEKLLETRRRKAAANTYHESDVS